MAVLVYFSVDQEDPDHVQYQFGPTRSMGRYLVIHKPTLEGWPVDTIQNVLYLSAYEQIVYRYQQTGQWPREGVIAS